ncbi:hypothetical protein O1L68_25880 [Streptomyces lydicus]|nr:hypothetical protein [Streptomyces lydicus]
MRGDRDLEAPDAVGQRPAVRGGRRVDGGLPGAVRVPRRHVVDGAAALQPDLDPVAAEQGQLCGAPQVQDAADPAPADQALAQHHPVGEVVAGVGERVLRVAEVGVSGVDAAVGDARRAGQALGVGPDDGGQGLVEPGAQAVGAQPEPGGRAAWTRSVR